MKRPYTFPHKTRKAMTEYLAAHESYHPVNSWNGGYVLSWNIKVHDFDSMGGHHAERNPSRDSAWRNRCENDSDMFWRACGDATRHYMDSEWTNYPGIEQGEWQFGVNGRSGGHMILTGAPAWLSAPRGRRDGRMTWDSRGDFHDWLADLPLDQLRRFYRAIRVLDKDLSPESCKREIECQFGFMRELWEDEQDSREQAAARLQEHSRPDLYGHSV